MKLVAGRLDEAMRKELAQAAANETIQKSPGGLEIEALIHGVVKGSRCKLPPQKPITRSVAKAHNIKVKGVFGNSDT